MMIPTIPTPDELLDKGFRRGKKAADEARSSRIPRSLKPKRIEEVRVVTACQVIKDRLKMINDRTPTVEELPEFYQDYIDITVGVDDLKQSLGALNWAYGIITQLEKDYARRIRRSPPENASKLRKQAYGRIASVVKKINKDLDFLDFAKSQLRNMPTIDFDATSIVIAGFPNVGKSTLLRQITDAEPEVANYPFTTKGIQIGHVERHWKHIQIIDTPGLLDRPISDMNDIEMNAMVALEDLADSILFIFDASETCGYTLEHQYNLLEEIQKIFTAPIMVLFNKIDIAEYENNGARFDYVNEFIEKTEDPLLISAAEGDGVDIILEHLDSVKKIDRNTDDY
jgi:nucleolar GTP-binding protein